MRHFRNTHVNGDIRRSVNRNSSFIDEGLDAGDRHLSPGAGKDFAARRDLRPCKVPFQSQPDGDHGDDSLLRERRLETGTFVGFTL